MLLAANLKNDSFLARLLILIKKGGLLQLNTGGFGVNMHLLVGAITFLMCLFQICYACYSCNQFWDKINND